MEAPLEEAGGAAAAAALAELEAAALAELERQGIAAAETRVERRGHVKYAGTDVSLAGALGRSGGDGRAPSSSCTARATAS